jgi:hypothetical protein
MEAVELSSSTPAVVVTVASLAAATLGRAVSRATAAAFPPGVTLEAAVLSLMPPRQMYPSQATDPTLRRLFQTVRSARPTPSVPMAIVSTAFVVMASATDSVSHAPKVAASVNA